MTGDYGLRRVKNSETNPSPYKLLVYGIIHQALLDIKPKRSREDPGRALDAILFLVECGPQYCEAAGWPIDPDHWEKVLLGKLKPNVTT
jgi:hypothetical protein